ncbi:hypothetical protein FKR81_09430 [Lentzea tibetensis]|uniref:Uncharacterized protein n=1 Tax=Lentzea tibetensis TaxID=2591470 RepID=A0A563EZI9_9PSEU|nr:hypothetical protein [Lentzea tibetensis]TWP52534.1 hypothetical protein FKR81_09430 [Lentzea tibetensis]
MRTRLTKLQQAVVDTGRPLPQLRDPLEVEMTLSACLGKIANNEELWDAVVRHLADVPSRRSQALLRALEGLLPGRPSEWAASAANQKQADEPPWNLKGLTFGECWIGDRSVDAGYLTLLTSYAYDEPHAMVFMIDEISGSIVRHAFLTRDVEDAVVRMAEQVRLESITPEAAHWLLSRSYDRFERRPGLGVSVDVHYTRLVARRRIGLALST